MNFNSMIWFKSFSVVKRERERVKLGDELEKREILKFSKKNGFDELEQVGLLIKG